MQLHLFVPTTAQSTLMHSAAFYSRSLLNPLPPLRILFKIAFLLDMQYMYVAALFKMFEPYRPGTMNAILCGLLYLTWSVSRFLLLKTSSPALWSLAPAHLLLLYSSNILLLISCSCSIHLCYCSCPNPLLLLARSIVLFFCFCSIDPSLFFYFASLCCSCGPLLLLYSLARALLLCLLFAPALYLFSFSLF